MAHWTANDIPWHRFDATKVRPEHLALVRTACLVEHNGDDYARYLCDVFHGDETFRATAVNWAAEEVQHGMVLRRWAEMADPAFDFDQSFADFRGGHQLPTDIRESVRGSRCGELIARCVVETGTSIYYTALKEATEEPVLQAICAKIAADEYRHYQLFYRYLQHYQKHDRISLMRRIAIALRRVAEMNDHELAYAFYAAQGSSEPYDRQRFSQHYFACVARMYEARHLARIAALILKAVGLKPNGRMGQAIGRVSWKLWQHRARRTAALLSKTLQYFPAPSQPLAA